MYVRHFMIKFSIHIYKFLVNDSINENSVFSRDDTLYYQFLRIIYFFSAVVKTILHGRIHIQKSSHLKNLIKFYVPQMFDYGKRICW